MASVDSQATRSTLLSVDTTLSENINATQNYIPVASTTNFSTSVVAEIESTNEVVSFATISENQFTFSEEFNNQPSSSRITITTNDTTAPDGTTTADKLIQASGQTNNGFVGNLNFTYLSAVYTFSVFLKNGDNDFASLDFGGGVRGWFNLSNGTIGTTTGLISSSISDEGNGWYRCSITATKSAGNSRAIVYLSNADNTNNGTPGQFIFAWGSQLEQASSPSTYLPTTSSGLVGLTTVTRGVNGTTAQAASSGDSIQQLPFAFQSVLTNGSSTLSENIDASQDYIPVASTSGFATGVNATIESTNEVVSFNDISENDFEHSEEFNDSYWAKTGLTLTADATTAPDGTTTADKIVTDSSTGVHLIDCLGFGNPPAGNNTMSIHVKKTGSFNFFYMRIDGGNTMFNIDTGAIHSTAGGVTATITDAGNGFFRIRATKNMSGGSRVFYGISNDGTNISFTGDGSSGFFVWGAQFENGTTLSTYLPTTSSALVGLTGVTRGLNGTTAASALSGATISQEPSLTFLGIPVRLRGLSVSPDGTGAARLTLCDNNGDSILDIDTPDGKVYTMNMPEDGLVFPNGVFISNTDNVTAYTLFTEKFSGEGLTHGS